MSSSGKQTTALIILDGWGHRRESRDNAIANGSTPVWDRLWNHSPHTLVSGSGLDVGLPAGQMGNSEVGHMSLGSGRIIYQSITRIDKAIEDGSFNSNEVYCDAIDRAGTAGGAVHIMGLLSPGGVHSHERHIFAAIRLAASRGVNQVYLHAFLDGRDTPPRSARPSLERAQSLFEELGCGRVASICGRYYAMDRDNNWERVQSAYELLTDGVIEHIAQTSVDGLEAAYERGENDEFVLPTAIVPSGQSAVVIEDRDSVIFMNFRADRARQLMRTFAENDFSHFQRGRQPSLSALVATTQYAADLDVPCAFGPENLS
ncbi:MAG: 2,3-bisphosphoglycerate-independent phosphoglycerate mutase, partial [Pseudomonadota bacterium]